MLIDYRKLKALKAEEQALLAPKKGGDLWVALIYPNSYFIGMSSLGLQWVYTLFNRQPGVICERFFLPDHPGQKLISIESRRPLQDFDLLAFTASYEEDIPNIFALLSQAGIPLRSAQRSDDYPLLALGGALARMNPEPLAECCDFIAAGDGEIIIPQICRFLLEGRSSTRSQILSGLAGIPGIYVPENYQVSYQEDGTIKAYHPAAGSPATIRIQSLAALSEPPHSCFITPNTEFKRTYLVEVARGCVFQCKFCALSWNYKPYRSANWERLKPLLAAASYLKAKIGLIASDLGSYPRKPELCNFLLETGAQISFSSLRSSSLTPELLQLLHAGGNRTLTLAPECGSEGLRFQCGKPIPDAMFFNAVEAGSRQGIHNLRLYFMIGLPGETYDDIKAIIVFCRQLLHLQKKFSHSQAKISLSVNPFVPKPRTPWQRVSQESAEIITDKLKLITAGMPKEIKILATGVKEAIWQGLWARADRALGSRLAVMGKTALKDLNSEIGFYLYRERRHTEILPWEILTLG